MYRFTTIELRDIAISLVVLCVVFSYPEFVSDPSFFAVSFLAVGIAFMGHELSHKFAAIRAGYWAEYRMWTNGLLMALMFSIATGGMFVFAAPGAVYFRTEPFYSGSGKRKFIRISMAGITFNIIAMWILLGLYFGTGIGLLSYMALINGWLAVFNLLPFGALDGEKIMKLDKRTWVLLFSAASIGFVLAQFF